MVGGKSGFNVNRAEFRCENALDGDIEYQRGGGCFVTTKKAIFLAILAIIALVAVGAFIYFYKASTSSAEEDSSADIEQLLNNSLHSVDTEDIRLPTHVRPMHYRLRIHPHLDEPNEEAFTFTGQVTILLQCVKQTTKIVLHSENLHIFEKEITVTTTKDLHLSSLSQIKSEVADTGNVTGDNNNNAPPPQPVQPNLGEADDNGIGNNFTNPLNQPDLPSETNASTAAPIVTSFSPVPTVIAIATTPPEPLPQPLPQPVPSSQPVPSHQPAASPQPVPLPQPVPSSEQVPVPQPVPAAEPVPLPQPVPSSEPVPLPQPPPSPQPAPTNVNATLRADVVHPSANVIPKDNHSQPHETLGDLSEKVKLTTVLPPPEQTSVYQVADTVHLNIKRQEEIKEMSRYVIYLTSALEVGHNYTVDIKFSGKILNNLVGLYKTNYLDAEGRKRWVLTTQFQPIFARRVFPCFDEPSFKAVFEISIARRTNMTTLSNMPMKESEQVTNQPGWVWDHFQKTPPMSTYLVAFTISDFENTKSTSPADLGPIFRIWAPKQSLANAQYAMEIGPKILSFLQTYFGVKYPLSKIDLVAIPELSQTAMENWGLMSFRDTALLLDPRSDNWATRNHIFKSIAGKLTKQWFGNLVTMEWWSDYWLSEGFATYMEDAIENAIDPTLEDLDAFPLRITQAILDSDKLKSVHSLHVDIKDPTQIEQLFDDVTSNKGSCLIRMLNYTLTEALFKEAIQNYLKTWMYKSATQDSLWDSCTQIVQKKIVIPSDLSAKDFMNSWIRQEGFPVVTVNRNYEMGSANITQSRFVHGNDTPNHLWHIPLTYTRENEQGAVSTLWMKQEETITAVNFTEPRSQKWVIFNIDGAGLYRVNYDSKNWDLLQSQLINDPIRITPANRGQLINDAFELANVGLLNYRTAFGLTKYLAQKERSYIPWDSLFNSLRPVYYIIGSTQYNGIFQQYILKMVKPLFEELGTSDKPNESQNNKILRNIIVRVACRINYEPCLKWAQLQFQEWMTSPEPDKTNPIPFSFRETVQCAAVKMGGPKEWNFLWQRSLHPSVSSTSLKVIYLTLGCTYEPWLINHYLESSLNGSTIALQNVRYVWKSIAHPVGLSVGLKFLRTNWNSIYEKYKHLFSNFNSIFEDFLSILSTKADLEDITIFYKSHKQNMHSVSSLMLNVVERIKWRISWTELHLKTVVTWLMENGLN